MRKHHYIECPVCFEEIKSQAKVCRFCGAVLTHDKLPEFVTVKPKSKKSEISREDLQDSVYDHFSQKGIKISDKHWRNIHSMLKTGESNGQIVTALYIDFCNYKEVSRKHSVEQIKNFLDKFYDLSIHFITLYSGFIVQFIGDAVFAIFGAPVSFDRDTESALKSCHRDKRFNKLY